MSKDIKIGENLYDIVVKLTEAATLVSEAAEGYKSAMEELAEVERGFEGKANDNTQDLGDRLYDNVGKLANYYANASGYIVYTLNEMIEKDEEIGRMIAEKVQSGNNA